MCAKFSQTYTLNDPINNMNILLKVVLFLKVQIIVCELGIQQIFLFCILARISDKMLVLIFSMLNHYMSKYPLKYAPIRPEHGSGMEVDMLFPGILHT